MLLPPNITRMTTTTTTTTTTLSMAHAGLHSPSSPPLTSSGQQTTTIVLSVTSSTSPSSPHLLCPGYIDIDTGPDTYDRGRETSASNDTRKRPIRPVSARILKITPTVQVSLTSIRGQCQSCSFERSLEPCPRDHMICRNCISSCILCHAKRRRG
jgi:hypothetical protein